MKPHPVHRLPAPLESAVQTLKLAARQAVERTIESLGLQSLAATNAFQRDGLLGAQFELNRKSAVFALAFNDAFDQRVLREAGAAASANQPLPTAWDALSLVEDKEVEQQIAAERFGLEVSHGCEWELRECNAFVAAILGYRGTGGTGDGDRNPLRPEVVGHAMVKAIEQTSERADVRKVLYAEIARSLGGMLRGTYAEIVADFRNAGVQPLAMNLRTQSRGSGDGAPVGGSFEHSTRAAGLADSRNGASLRSGPNSAQPSHSGYDTRYGSRRSGPGGFGSTGGRGTLGQVDPALMSLIRRIAHTHVHTGGGAVSDSGGGGNWDDYVSGSGAPLPNLIHAHRDELRSASTGSLDHMVIDLIGTLFDQILSDPKVPPQMARQIARLQLPVLRAALGDSSFFSSRKHPVRRFVNRIASLAVAFEDFSEEGAQRFLAKVRALVQEVVEGDFDQIAVYQNKLNALETFVAEQARRDVQQQGDAAELLSQKEDELRLRQLYAARLEGELKTLAGPAFVRDFIAKVWSQVLLRAAALGDAKDERVQRLRRAGRELFMSVQPKATPAHRKVFLAELPQLMQALTEGLNLIGWPEAQRRAFFGQLMPAHAEALKTTAVRQLDVNLLARQVENLLDRPLPSRDDLKGAPALPVLTDEVVPSNFSPEEAQRIGLVEEAAVAWNQPAVPAPANDDRPADAGDTVPGGLDGAHSVEHIELPPAVQTLQAALLPSETAEPTAGRELADHVQIGFAYQMQLQGEWQKVRLSHVSPGRSFFVFTHGKRHLKTVSLTQRMLVRLCETGRLRAFESAYLIERATLRARRQLATMAVGA
jgi:hypothetical protein